MRSIQLNTVVLEMLAEIIRDRSRESERFIIGLAGPPGAGKSTLSLKLAKILGSCEILAADGFHYDNVLLEQFNLLERKGASNTFDIDGLKAVLSRLCRQEDVIAPVFDRQLDMVRGCSVHFPSDLRYVIVEGNYITSNLSG